MACYRLNSVSGCIRPLHYLPELSAGQLVQQYGGGRNYRIEMDVAIGHSEILGINSQQEGFVLHAQPLSLRVYSLDNTTTIYDRPYQVATLGRGQTTTASPFAAPPAGEYLPFSAETADLLVAKFLPETLNQAAIERMMLARWHYETSFNRSSGTPQWGRFFVEGKSKPDAQQRAELAARFRDWTLKRAQAMPGLILVVVPYVQIREPGPLQMSVEYYSILKELNRETNRCRSHAAGTRRNKPELAQTHENACAFLEDAATRSSRELYLGTAGSDLQSLSLEQRRRHVQTGASLDGTGIGPRWVCNVAVRSQDEYCHTMLRELGSKGELFGQKPALDDVLVLDRELVVPAGRPDILAPVASGLAVELDLKVTGIRQTSRLPPHPLVTAYKAYDAFLQKAGLSHDGGRWADQFDKETVPLYLFDTHVAQARLVNTKTRETTAQLELQEPRTPDVSLLKIVEPERVAGPGEPYGPDVVGIRLGMKFDEADKIIRKHMKVGRVLEADRAWQSNAAAGDIRPYTSGRLYENEEGTDVIILFDEPPATSGVVIGLLRQTSFPKNKVAHASVVDSLEKKYGKASGQDPTGPGQIWYLGQVKNNLFTGAACSPSFNAANVLNIWRNPDGSPIDWKPETTRYSGMTPSMDCNLCNERSVMTDCPAGLSATFDNIQNNTWDRLVVRVFDQRVYARLLDESKRLLENGEGFHSTSGAAVDLKL